MPFGLLTGLTAALFWGTLDVITALGSRVIGSLRVTAGMQSVTAVAFLVIFIASGSTLPTEPRDLGLAALLGLIGAGAYLSYFTGLQFGPIAVVSGMVSAFGGLTVVLSVVVRGESLDALQAVGASVATVGVLLTALAFDGGLRSTRFAGPGVVFALVALVLFSLMAITTDVALETMTWIQIYTIARVVNASIGTVAVLVLARRATSQLGQRPTDGPRWSDRRVAGAIILAGALDVVGLVAFATGLETAPTWMVGLAASLGPAVTIMVAVAFLGERLRPIQWFGLAGILTGMVCIAIPWPPSNVSGRETEPEVSQAVARLGADLTTLGLDQLLDDRQTDTRAATCGVARFLDAVEAFEHAPEVIGWDAVAGVGDRDQEVGRPALRTNGDAATWRCVAGRVRQEVAKDLGKVIRVGPRGEGPWHGDGDRQPCPLEGRQGELHRD